MAGCKVSDDCSKLGTRMICVDGKCGCDIKNYVLLDDLFARGCFPKAQLFTECITSAQCSAVNRNTYCNRNGRCTCSPGYFFDGQNCIIRYDTNLKAQEVYKAAVVAAACFIVAVVGIFVACIVRRSFCRRDLNTHQNNSTNNDVFTVSDEIAALRAVDKPPSYEEVLQIERTFFGIPPPEYNSLRGGSRRVNQNSVPFTSNELHQTYFQQNTSSFSRNQVPESEVNDSNRYCQISTVTAQISTLPSQSQVNEPLTDFDSSAPNEFNSLSSVSSYEECHQASTLPRIPLALRRLCRNTSAPTSAPPCLHRVHLLPSSSASLPNSPHSVTASSQQSPNHSETQQSLIHFQVQLNESPNHSQAQLNESPNTNHQSGQNNEALTVIDTGETNAYDNLAFIADNSK